MEDQQSLPGSTAEGKKNSGVATRILAMLVVGAVVGLLIYFSPRLFFGAV